MSNKKQSSVEWLWDNLTYKIIGDLSEDNINLIYKLVEKAKAMHKDETEDAYFRGYTDNMNDEGDFEQYYEETYGGGE